MPSQKQRVIDELNTNGVVSNFWAIKNYMLRLGAIILDLKKDGYIFRTGWGTGSEKKNYHYYLVSRPKGQQGLQL
jgi:hypothetical protein